MAVVGRITAILVVAAIVAGCGGTTVPSREGVRAPRVVGRRVLKRYASEKVQLERNIRMSYRGLSADPGSGQYVYAAQALSGMPTRGFPRPDTVVNNSIYLSTQEKALIDLGRREMSCDTVHLFPGKEDAVAYAVRKSSGEELVRQSRKDREVVYRTRAGIFDFAWNPTDNRYVAVLLRSRGFGKVCSIVMVDTHRHSGRVIKQPRRGDLILDVEFMADGKKLLYQLSREGLDDPDEVVDLDLSSGLERVVAKHGSLGTTTVSPEGRWLAVTLGSQLNLVNLRSRKRFPYRIDVYFDMSWLDESTLLITNSNGIEAIKFDMGSE